SPADPTRAAGTDPLRAVRPRRHSRGTHRWSRRGEQGTGVQLLRQQRSLFTLVLRDELMKVAQTVPIESFATEDVGDYAGRAYDYHRQHPELTRLLRWEGLVLDDQVPDEELRRRHYEYKSRAMSDGQAHGAITTSIDAGHLFFLVLSLAGWWSAAPQVARMLT